MSRHLILLILVFTAIAATGCENVKTPPGMPKLYPATVSVVQDGQPLPDAVVSLIPEEAENRWSSGGVTNAKGEAKLMTYGQFPGVPAGRYKVCISKQEVVGELDYSEDPANPKGRREVFEVIDLVFKTEATTTLELEVLPQSKNNASFDVGQSLRIKAAVPGV